MLQDKILYLSEDFRKVNADYTKVLGTKEKQKRWKICTTETNFNLGLPVANLFITRYFNKITKLKVIILINYSDCYKSEISDWLVLILKCFWKPVYN